MARHPEPKTKPRKSSSEKRAEIGQLVKKVDLVEFQIKTQFDKQLIESAYWQSSNRRNSWRRKKRQKNQIYKNKHANFSQDKLDKFLESEKRLNSTFELVKTRPDLLDNYIDLVADMEKFIPGSGLIHLVIRHIGKIFFQCDHATTAWTD